MTGQVSSTDEAGKASRYQVDRGMPRYQAHMLGYRQKSLAIEQSQLAVTKRMSRDVDYLIHESYSIIHQEFRRGGMILTHPLWRCADRCLASSSTREMPPSAQWELADATTQLVVMRPAELRACRRAKMLGLGERSRRRATHLLLAGPPVLLLKVAVRHLRVLHRASRREDPLVPAHHTSARARGGDHRLTSHRARHHPRPALARSCSRRWTFRAIGFLELLCLGSPPSVSPSQRLIASRLRLGSVATTATTTATPWRASGQTCSSTPVSQQVQSHILAHSIESMPRQWQHRRERAPLHVEPAPSPLAQLRRHPRRRQRHHQRALDCLMRPACHSRRR